VSSSYCIPNLNITIVTISAVLLGSRIFRTEEFKHSSDGPVFRTDYNVFRLNDGGELWKDTKCVENKGVYYGPGEWITNFHRIGGPAKILPEGDKHFYIKGVEFSEEDYWKQPELIPFLKFKEEDRQEGADLLDI
jgi:hypothetical protein